MLTSASHFFNCAELRKFTSLDGEANQDWPLLAQWFTVHPSRKIATRKNDRGEICWPVQPRSWRLRSHKRRAETCSSGKCERGQQTSTCHYQQLTTYRVLPIICPLFTVMSLGPSKSRLRHSRGSGAGVVGRPVWSDVCSRTPETARNESIMRTCRMLDAKFFSSYKAR